MTALHAAGGGLPLALHIPHVVEQAGSLAGFAAVIGLAVLSALYFSQARDLRRLREWAGRAPERAAEGQPAPVPGRVVAVPQQRPAGAPAAANGDAAPAVTAGAAAPPVAQPAADTAKAGAAGAEKPDAEAKPDGDAKPGEEGAEAAKADGASDGDAKPDDGKPGEAKPDDAKDGDAGSPPRPGMPAPASAAAAAGASAASVVGPSAPAATPPASTPPAPRPTAQPQRPPGSVLPPRTGTLPPVRRLPASPGGAGQTGVLGSAPPPKKKRNPLYVLLAIAGVLIVGAAAAVGVPAIVNGTKDNNKPSKSKSTTTAAKKKKAPVVAPDKITVAVLNGTSIPGLAAQIGDRVDAEGFTLGTVSNASTTQGQRANSVAMYSPGHQRDASAVARKLNIRNVQPIDAGSQGIAGDASVVVIVGSDKTQ
ncbi:MAG: hypothetical protein QOJ29_168 [Thermoleophilaceae bacterium]|jgi:hypothetical protein|nr:hypothetical protein [Thermoleophilaceae bacterium]